jgi:plastocyanin
MTFLRPVVAATCLLLAPFSAGAAAPTAHTVVIADMKFSPETLTAKPGDTIVWVNKDFFPHNARAADRAFQSPDLETNRTWRYVAGKSGTYSYVCTLHPTMKGTLVVK